jgi:hypothetical protein
MGATTRPGRPDHTRPGPDRSSAPPPHSIDQPSCRPRAHAGMHMCDYARMCILAYIVTGGAADFRKYEWVIPGNRPVRGYQAEPRLPRVNRAHQIYCGYTPYSTMTFMVG